VCRCQRTIHALDRRARPAAREPFVVIDVGVLGHGRRRALAQALAPLWRAWHAGALRGKG